MSKSSKSSMRIVLVDPLGDILFSGESIAQALPTDGDLEGCPETMRSPTSDSGIFPTASHHQDENSDEIRSARTRAA